MFLIKIKLKKLKNRICSPKKNNKKRKRKGLQKYSCDMRVYFFMILLKD